MICNKCNFQNEETAKFCRNCGINILGLNAQPKVFNCQKCNAENEETAKFCRNCGIKLHNIQKQKSDIKGFAKISVIVFAIMFLIGLVFRLQYWPGANLILSISLLVNLSHICFSVFTSKNGMVHITTLVMTILFFLGLADFFTSWLRNVLLFILNFFY